ncbi:MAG: GNAT family N-acetyltransferase [Caldimonas sp.]
MDVSLTAQCLPESDYDAWDAFVIASSHGSIYNTTAYLAALCEATGGTFRILAAGKGDGLVGGVALYERRSGPDVRVAPRSLLFYNGIVLRDFAGKYPSQRTARTLEASAALEAGVSAYGYKLVALRSVPAFTDTRSFSARGWTVRPGYTYVVPIGNLELAWERVEQNLRRLVKRCSQQGFQFTEDDDFDSFLRMHVAMTARKGLPLYLPEQEFKRFFRRLREQDLCRLYQARLPSGQAVSAQLVLTGKHRISHSVCAAADPDYLNTGATAFLRWKAFEALSASGYSANDLTDAALNPVTHFKSQLGGNLEMCLICEKLQTPRKWHQRLKSKVAAFVPHR